MEHHDGFICHALGPVEDQKLRPTCWRSFVRSLHVVGRCGSPLAPSWQAPRACKRRKAVRYTSRTTPHVTCVTRHAQNAKPTSRCRTVAPWSIPFSAKAVSCRATFCRRYSPKRWFRFSAAATTNIAVFQAFKEIEVAVRNTVTSGATAPAKKTAQQVTQACETRKADAGS